MKYLLLGEFVDRVAALLAIGEGNLRVSKGSQQALQPVGVDGIDVRTGDDDQLTLAMPQFPG